jgi:hypothetical protein
MYSVQDFNKHALPIIITKSEEVQFSIQFLLKLHLRFANLTQFSLCKSNQQKLENVKKKQITTPYLAKIQQKHPQQRMNMSSCSQLE